MTPEDPGIGMAKVLLVNALSMGTAIVSLVVFYLWDRPALTWFGLSLVAGFLFVASVELLRYGGRSTTGSTKKK
jgi:hypothetical protein